MTTVSQRLETTAPITRSRALHYLPTTAFLVDLGLITVSVMLGVVGRNHLPLFHGSTDVSASALRVAPIVIGGWLALLSLFGGYRKDVFGAGADEYRRVFSASLYAAGLLCGICYLLHYALSRGFFALTFLIGMPLLLVGRLALRRALQRARARGAFFKRVMIVGSPTHVDEIASVLRRERWLGYQVAGALTPSSFAAPETLSGIPVVGHVDDVHEVPGHLAGVDVAFFTGGNGFTSADLRQIQWDLEQHDVQLVLAPSVTDMGAERVRMRPVGGLPLMHLEAPRWAQAGRWAKRAFDIAGTLALLTVTLPLFAWAALWIKLHDRGPVFFRQTRIGRNGEEFGCLKFRTMVIDAEALVAKLQEEQGTTALLFKMKDDPRITGPGRLLRRLSIDELPQLLNVLRGDMSLVGPRPQVAREVELYDDALRRRLNVRPGMTGLWQVSGRNDLSVEDSARLDLYYVDNWSMMQDLTILGRTFSAVVGSRGAY